MGLFFVFHCVLTNQGLGEVLSLKDLFSFVCLFSTLWCTSKEQTHSTMLFNLQYKSYIFVCSPLFSVMGRFWVLRKLQHFWVSQDTCKDAVRADTGPDYLVRADKGLECSGAVMSPKLGSYDNPLKHKLCLKLIFSFLTAILRYIWIYLVGVPSYYFYTFCGFLHIKFIVETTESWQIFVLDWITHSLKSSFQSAFFFIYFCLCSK